MGEYFRQPRAGGLEYRSPSSSSEPTPYQIKCCLEYRDAIQAVGPAPMLGSHCRGSVKRVRFGLGVALQRSEAEGFEVLRMSLDRLAEHYGYRPPRDDSHDTIASWLNEQNGCVRVKRACRGATSRRDRGQDTAAVPGARRGRPAARAACLSGSGSDQLGPSRPACRCAGLEWRASPHGAHCRAPADDPQVWGISCGLVAADKGSRPRF
jgi:hypothetical protein